MNNKNRESFVTVDDFKKKYGVHFTMQHGGKMEGMQSLSTSVLCNKFCEKNRKDPNKVCSKCFAAAQMKCYTNMMECFKRNTEALSKEIIPVKEWPLLNASVFRLESFGDVNNWIQVVNYFNLCRKNKNVSFALWTKNPELIAAAIKMGYKKPKNLQIVLSSHFLNKVADINKWEFIDKIFTVFTKDYIEEHNVNINCGKAKCLACGKCYRKNKEVYINEELK